MNRGLIIQTEGDLLRVTYDGLHNREQIDRLIQIAAAECSKQKIKKLLVDLRESEGDLLVMEKFSLARKTKVARDLGLRVAVLDRSERRMSDRFFENVAVNRGVRIRFFEKEDESRSWLDQV